MIRPDAQLICRSFSSHPFVVLHILDHAADVNLKSLLN